MPMPTSQRDEGGLRPCWIATMEAPIIGPIADSNSVICTTLPPARSNPTYTSMTSAGPTSNLKAMPSDKRHFDAAELIEPQLQSDRNQSERGQRCPPERRRTAINQSG